MFYDNRKIIYTVLIIVALSISFFCGKKVGSNIPLASNKTTTNTKKTDVQENKNYNTTLNIKGTNYSFDYSIINAFFTDKSTLNFGISIQNNKNIINIKVICRDQENNILTVTPVASTDTKVLNYLVKINDDTTNLKIEIYPLTKAMAANKNLNISTVPFNDTELNVSLVKKIQIDNLQ
jgi:hypothetical protein